VPPDADPFPRWFAALEARHLGELKFAEVRKGLQALSSLYVQRRERIAGGAALEGAGKRAAFALYYGPLHFLLVREIVRALTPPPARPPRLLDLGCGTGAAGAAWASESRLSVEGVDLSGWAVQESRVTFSSLGVSGRARKGDASTTPLESAGAILLAYTANELDDGGRAAMLPRLLAAHRAGAQVLVLEPISRRAVPWWPSWSEVFLAAGGRDDEWRFRALLPPTLALLDKAAGLDHRELTGRTLFLGPHPALDAG
jgi:hypothetical protein